MPSPIPFSFWDLIIFYKQGGLILLFEFISCLDESDLFEKFLNWREYFLIYFKCCYFCKEDYISISFSFNIYYFLEETKKDFEDYENWIFF